MSKSAIAFRQDDQENSAIGSGSGAQGAGGVAGTGGPGSLTATNILLPVAEAVSGDVLLLGSVASSLHAHAAALAGSLTAHARLPPGADPVNAPPAYDTILAFDLFAPADEALPQVLRALRQSLRRDGRLILALGTKPSGRGASVAEHGGSRDPGGGTGAWDCLRRALEAAGFPHQHWWYPFPDHRAARTVLFERGLAPESGLDAAALAGDASGERRAWRRIAKAGGLADHAPSALVLASAVGLPAEERLALQIGHERRPEFNKVATILTRAEGPPEVRRVPRRPGLPRCVAGITNRFPSEALAPGQPWPEALEAVLARDGWTESDVATWVERWITAVQTAFLGADPGDRPPDADTLLPGHAFDAIPRNLLVHGGEATFIDLEWTLDAPLDVGHLLVRGLVDTFLTTPIRGCPARGLDPTFLTLLHACTGPLGDGLSDAGIAERLDREARFQRVVGGHDPKRDFAWLATTHPLSRSQLLLRATTLADEVAGLRGERAALIDARDAAQAQTDRVIVYAAERDREAERLEAALAGAEARLAGPPPRPPGLAIRLGRAVQDLVPWKRT